MFALTANVVDILGRQVRPARVQIEAGRITAIKPLTEMQQSYLVPGLIDAHVHVESSMLVPSQFARAAVVHGTVGTVSDPHEIANVLGIDGVEYMLDDARQVPFKFCFGAPSCVPATTFETSGAMLDDQQVATLLARKEIGYLSEVMDYPGVINRRPDVMRKIQSALDLGKPVDGHAPGLRGQHLTDYLAAGITTDHECCTEDEARDRLAAGCHILIREGSAARNFTALAPLIDEFPEQVMLCSDDKHPDELQRGHIDELIRHGLRYGLDVFCLLRAACINPVDHYGLNVGRLRVGDPADFIEVDSLESFRIRRTYIDGELVAENGVSLLAPRAAKPISHIVERTVPLDAFRVPILGDRIHVIDANGGQLITTASTAPPTTVDGYAASDTQNDLLKLVVVNRYAIKPPAVAFVRGFGLKRGAIASSVAHDSHNVVAVGACDDDLCAAVNLVFSVGGGLSLVNGSQRLLLSLPVAGLMSTDSIESVAAEYDRLDTAAKDLGSELPAPFMTLSFMALLVIPEIKLSDRGLFDSKSFRLIPLFCE